jgi:voltage-gated potassium channel
MGRSCVSCGTEILRRDAEYCRSCGHKLGDE